MRKISPPPGFDPRTVQPVASRYTDYAARPTVKVRSRIFQKIKLTVKFKYIILIYDVYNRVSESVGVGARCYVLQCEFFLCSVAQNAASANKLLDAPAHL